MTDNAVMAIIIATLRSGLTSYSGLTVQQSYQPTDQGVPEGPALFVHGVIDRPYGYIAARTTYNDGDGDFDFVESEGVLNTFQVSALMPDDVGNVAALTAKDLCNSARGLLQLRATVQALRSLGLGIARISQTRILHFTNDSGRSEEMPSFDFDVNYARVVSTTKVPAVTGLDYDSVVIDRV